MRLIDADQLLSFIELDERVIAPVGHTAQDIVMMIQTAPTIVQTDTNVSLTLEELRQMDGEPVWIVPMRGSGGFCTWMLVDAEYELCREAHGEMAVFENCGKTWLAYRRKPEEGMV